MFSSHHSFLLLSPINYNEKGQRSDIHYGNGCKTRYEYDKNTFRLIRLFTNRNDNNNDENVLQDIHYTYDPVGNIVEIVDNAHQKKYFDNAVIEPKGQYEYDALYRLIKATGRELSSLQLPTHSDFANNIPVPNMGNNAMQNYTQQFTYDELGNIIQMKSVGQWTRDYYYDMLHNNYLTGHTPRAIDYTYDEHGNMLKMPHLQSMHYDYQDQLNKVVLDASENTAYYIYDAGGQRVRKVIEKTGGIKEERYYLGNYEVYRKFVGITLETERTTVAVADDKRKIATIDKLTVDKRSLINLPVAVIRYQYDNHLGSASLELDATAQIISYEEYHPFGTTSYRSGKSETEVSQKRYKYVGKERDEETGLYYYGARYYAAWIGRFVSVDPLQFDYPQLTPFNYAGNKPVTHIDIDGMQSTGDKPLQIENGSKLLDESLLENENSMNSFELLYKPQNMLMTIDNSNELNEDNLHPDFLSFRNSTFETVNDFFFVMELAKIDINYGRIFNQLSGSDKTTHFVGFKYKEIKNINEDFISGVTIRDPNNINRILIFFTKGDSPNATEPYTGVSKYGVLAEETYHALDAIIGKLDFDKPTYYNEAEAWQFSSIIIGTNMREPYYEKGKQVALDYTFMYRIRNASTQQVADWFKYGMPAYIDKEGNEHRALNAPGEKNEAPTKGLYYNPKWE